MRRALVLTRWRREVKEIDVVRSDCGCVVVGGSRHPDIAGEVLGVGTGP